MRIIRLCILLSTLVATLPSLAAPPADCATLLVAPGDRPTSGAGSFSASDVADLELAVVFPWKLARDWRKVEHQLEVEVLNPRGNTYQRLDARFLIEGNGKSGALFLPGQTEPAEAEVILSGKAKSFAVKVRLPIAGSSIVQNSMYGEWKVRARVDEQLVSCEGAPTMFVILP